MHLERAVPDYRAASHDESQVRAILFSSIHFWDCYLETPTTLSPLDHHQSLEETWSSAVFRSSRSNPLTDCLTSFVGFNIVMTTLASWWVKTFSDVHFLISWGWQDLYSSLGIRFRNLIALFCCASLAMFKLSQWIAGYYHETRIRSCDCKRQSESGDFSRGSLPQANDTVLFLVSHWSRWAAFRQL